MNSDALEGQFTLSHTDDDAEGEVHLHAELIDHAEDDDVTLIDRGAHLSKDEARELAGIVVATIEAYFDDDGGNDFRVDDTLY